MKYYLSIILSVFYISCWSQDFSIKIDPGDNAGEMETVTLLANRNNYLYIDYEGSGIDSYSFETNNGEIVSKPDSYNSLVPKNTGNATITATVKFRNGQTVTKSRTFDVIKYPELELRVQENNLLKNGTIQFQLFIGAENVSSEFASGHFEFELLNENKEVIFESPALGQLLFNLNWYDPNFKIKEGQLLIFSPMRTLWKKYNLSVFTKELTIIIK